MSRMAEQVGRVLRDRYRLLAPIGSGASAQVFLAEDVVLRRRVAVKLLHPALAHDEAFLRRFHAEARSAAALSHPHLLAVYDYGDDDDGPWLVLEYLSGGSLRTLLDRGHLLSPSQALLVGLEAARGLDHAHRRGLVHRDIKPANLLFDDEGRLRIADFGIARALAEAGWTEPTGAMLGSVRYASPEQAQGGSLDGRSDVYSLALVLVEAVTGSVPFTADTPIATLMARVGNAVVAPPELEALGPVVERAGRPEPAERPDAAAFARALEQAATDLPRPAPLPVGETAVPAPGWEPVDRDPTQLPTLAAPAQAEPEIEVVRRRRRWPWVVSLVVLLAVAATIGALLVAEARVPAHAVPDVTNGTEAEARRALSRFEFDVEVERRFVDNTTKGVVLDQEPDEGESLKEGRTVRLVVSNGPPVVVVPDLAGLDRAAAEARLVEAGFTVVFEERFDETAPAGQVLDWSGRDERHPKGTEIGITVSAGPQPRRLSDWRGKTWEETAAAFEAAGLHASRNDVFDDEIEVGKVVSTKPAAGTDVPRGSTVTVNVSKGPDVVAVPNVKGRTVEQATAALEAAGFSVTNVFGPVRGKVFDTNPAAGTKVKRGRGIDLYTK